MVIVVEEKDLSQALRVEILSRFGNETTFCRPRDIRDTALKDIVFADLYFEALSFCLVHEIEIRFLYRGRILSHGDVRLIGSIQKELLESHHYTELKKLNFMKIFLEVSGKKSVLQSLPAHIQLEHTTYCNARCIMCDHYIAHNRGAKHLDIATARRLSAVLPYVSMMIMHGNGEPFLNPDIIEILELYKKYDVRVSTNTNLSCINDEICSELDQVCDSLHISCDGCDKETYEGIRQGLSFDVFCNNLKRISALSSMREMSLEVVLMQQNITKAQDFIRFAHSYGIKTVRFHDLGINTVIGSEKYSLRSCPDIANHYISIAREEGEKTGVTVKGFEYRIPGPATDEPALYVSFPDRRISEEMHRKHSWYTNVIAVSEMSGEGLMSCEKDFDGLCEYPFAKSYLDLNGNVSVCCPSSRKVVGHVSSPEDFIDLWNSETMVTIRDEYYAGRMPSFCRNCFMVQERSLSWLDHKEEHK